MSALYPLVKRTNNVFFNSLLGTLESIGASNIVHNGRVIRFTHAGKARRVTYSIHPGPGHVSGPVQLLKHLGLIPTDPTKPGEQKNDPNILKMQQGIEDSEVKNAA
jgi:hypothetical protein